MSIVVVEFLWFIVNLIDEIRFILQLCFGNRTSNFLLLLIVYSQVPDFIRSVPWGTVPWGTTDSTAFSLDHVPSITTD